LLREQISIAAGNKISFEQNDIKINGFALECRIYSEDSANNFLPSTGKILHYKEPNGIGVRVDSGFSAGSEISIYYDPMIAKIICWDKDREKSINRMKRALSEMQIAGITTNINFLKYILGTTDFFQGKYDINFIDNINFAEKFKNELKRTNEEMKVAASVFAGLLKSKRKNKFKAKSTTNTNEWWGQNYE